MWLHVHTGTSNCRKGAIACLNQKRGITGIILSHQTGGSLTGWAYKQEGL